MSQSWQINPATGDYEMENGAPIPSESLKYPAYYRMKVSRNQWLYAPDPNYGSDFYLAKKRSGLGSNQGLVSIGEKALQPLIDDGRAASVEVAVASDIETARGNGAFRVTIEDIQGNSQELNLPPIGGT